MHLYPIEKENFQYKANRKVISKRKTGDYVAYRQIFKYLGRFRARDKGYGRAEL